MRSVVYWRLWTAIVFLLEGMCVALAVQKPTKLAVRLMGFWKTESGVFDAQTSPTSFECGISYLESQSKFFWIILGDCISAQLGDDYGWHPICQARAELNSGYFFLLKLDSHNWTYEGMLGIYAWYDKGSIGSILWRC